MTRETKLDQRDALEALFKKLVLDTSRRTYASTTYLRAIASPRQRGSEVWVAIQIQPERSDTPWPISEYTVQIMGQEQCEARIEAGGRVLIGPMNVGRHTLRVGADRELIPTLSDRSSVAQMARTVLEETVRERVQRLRDALRVLVLPVPSLAVRGGPLVTRGGQSGTSAPGRVITEGSGLDPQLQWRVTKDKSGVLHAVITSSDVELLRGANVWLNTDPARVVGLVETAGEQRADFVISKEEQSQMRGRPVVKQIVLANGEVIAPNK